MSNGEIPLLIAVPAIGLFVVIPVVLMVSSVSGADAEAARKAAETYMSDLGLTGRVVCQSVDTDGDGYISCTAREDNGEMIPIECSGAISLNSGCRAQKPGSGRRR